MTWQTPFRLFQRHVCVTRNSNSTQGRDAVTMVTMGLTLGAPMAGTSCRLRAAPAVVDVSIRTHGNDVDVSAIPAL